MVAPVTARPTGAWAYQRGVIWALELGDGEAPAPAAPRVPARFAEVGAAAAGPLAQAMGRRDTSEIQRRLDKGRRCFVAWVEEAVASYCWISHGVQSVSEMERVIRMLPDEAYVWDCATVPAQRRQGLYTALLGFINERLADEGLRRVWIGTNLENAPSLKAFESAGYRPVATLTHARILGLYAYVTNADDEAPGALRAAARRLFGLDRLPSLGPVAVGWRWPASGFPGSP